MQTTLPVFLALLIAHLLGDFVFQADALVAGKKDRRWRAFMYHGISHYLLGYVVALCFVPNILLQARFHLLLVLLVLLHLVVDLAKERLLNSHFSRRLSFCVDQVIHIGLIFLIIGLLEDGFFAWAMEGYAWYQGRQEKILWLLVVYLATIFGGGYFIRMMLPEGEAFGDEYEAMDRGGMYIGWLERFITLTAVLGKSPTLIGLIFAAKSIVRLEKLKSDRFAEYYLLGTFLSLCLALIAGLFLLWLFGGSIFSALEE